MNASLVKIEAMNDCLLLVEESNEISSTLREAISKERHFALIADAVRPSELLEREFLEHCRALWNQEPGDEQLDAKLALLIGLSMLQGLEKQGSFPTSGEESLYYDAFMYRLYYVDGIDSELQEESIRDLFRALRQRCTIELHTFVANRDAVDEWIGEMSEWDLRINGEIEQFAKAVAVSSNAKLNQFQSDKLFYSADDALLQLLMRLRQGESVSKNDLQTALLAQPESSYAKSVLASYKQLLIINGYFAEAAV